MKCKQVLEQLSSYLDDELSSKKSQKIKIHLAKCEKCREEKDELLACGVAPIRQAHTQQVSKGFWDVIEKKLEKKELRDASAYWIGDIVSMRSGKILAVAASVLIAVSLVFFRADEVKTNDVETYLNEQIYFVCGFQLR